MTGYGVCHSCLRASGQSFCRSCRKLLFRGRSISHVLDFTRADFSHQKTNSGGRLSISGVQIKHLLTLSKSRLLLSDSGGEYILKPSGAGAFLFPDALAANEHLTMQIASQVFGVAAAPCAYMQMSDGTPVYITKRFDRTEGGAPLPAEDFAQLAGKSAEREGINYKYNSSYEELGGLIKKYVSASELELEKLFRLVLFNYLLSNGDAHLKNFTLLRNEEFGDYLLSPAYDLVCTRLHLPNESDTALEFFAGGFETESFKAGTKYLREDFLELAKRFGLQASLAAAHINSYIQKEDAVIRLTKNSFLPEELKPLYIQHYRDKTKRLV